MSFHIQNQTSERPVEQRSESRTATVFRPVLIETEDFAGFCLVRNLSPSGLMGQVYADFAPDIPVMVQFGQESLVHGEVKWCKDGRVGVQFDEEIAVSALLAEISSRTLNGKVNRAPRLSIQANVRLLFEKRTFDADLIDISQRGLKVRAPFLHSGDEIEVHLNGMNRRKAVVRWTQAGTAGLNFVIPIPFSDLAEWVISQYPGLFGDDDTHVKASDVRTPVCRLRQR